MDQPFDLQQKNTFYHGTRSELKPGDRIEPYCPLPGDEKKGLKTGVTLTPNLDEAIWDAEIAIGEHPSRVYLVDPMGEVGKVADLRGGGSPINLSMSYYSYEPLRVVAEVTNWPFYHGTKADLKLGDLIKPGQIPNFGNKDRTSTYVYLTCRLDAAIWGAELATGAAPCRIYAVRPRGSLENDPNLTNTKFHGNPTQSFRSREPLEILGEVTDWRGHSPEAIKAMKEGLSRLEQLGIDPID